MKSIQQSIDEVNNAMHRTYSLDVVCFNCGGKGPISITRGRRVTEQYCPTCGCKTLIRSHGATAFRTTDV